MDSHARQEVLGPEVLQRSCVRALQAQDRSRRNLLCRPRATGQMVVQKRLSKVYARAAAATMSSIDSPSVTTPLSGPSVGFEGGRKPVSGHLRDSSHVGVEARHAANKSPTSSQQTPSSNGPSNPAREHFERWNRNQADRQGGSAAFVIDGEGIAGGARMPGEDPNRRQKDAIRGATSTQHQPNLNPRPSADSDNDFNTSDHECQTKQLSIKDLRKRVLSADKMADRQSIQQIPSNQPTAQNTNGESLNLNGGLIKETKIQRKRQRNKDRYKNRNANCSSSQTAKSAKCYGNGAGAGVADFQESGSNYGRVVSGEPNPSSQRKHHRPWRRDPVHGPSARRISEIIDDTSALTKSPTVLNSKVNGEQEVLGEEEKGDMIFKRDVEDLGIVDYRSEEESEGVMAEGNGQNFHSDDYHAPNESSAGGDVNFSGSHNHSAADVAILVQQCKLKRQRFTFLGRDAHTIENYGGKAEPIRAFRSQIAPINIRSNQSDEVQSIQSQSSGAPVDRKFRYGPIKKATSRISLTKSQCKLQRPTMSLIETKNAKKDARNVLRISSPRQNISNASAQEIDSIHSDEDAEVKRQKNTEHADFNMQGEEKQPLQTARPSEETIFLSSQEIDSHQVNQIDDQGEIRLKSAAKLSNKAMQTTMTLSPELGRDTMLNAISTPQNAAAFKPMNRYASSPPTKMMEYSARTVNSPQAGTRLPAPWQKCESKANVVQYEVVPGALEIEQAKYLQQMTASQAKDEDSFQYIKNYMKTSQIQCFKYNSSLEQQAQNQACFDAFISLSNDGKWLVITNIRPATSIKRQGAKEQEKHHHSASSEDEEPEPNDPDELQPQNIFKEIEEQAEEDLKEQELELKNAKRKLVRSSASCKLSEIQSFIYGGFSSRFWMLRKHINSMSKQELKDLPFHSWNCITLKLGRRDVDLVIKDEHQMQVLIKFLVFSLCTLDGTKNSARPLLSSLIAQELQEIKKQTGKSWTSAMHEHKVQVMYEERMFKQISFKYKIMRIRAKIGLMALQKGLTIQEIFLHAIYKTFVQFIDYYKFDLNDQHVQADQMYQAIISFEKNLRMVAQQHRDKDQTASVQDQSTTQNDIPRHDEQAKIEQLNNFKNNMKKSWQMVLDPSLGNPYRKYENQSKNLELYTKEQLRNKKKRSVQKNKPTTRPSADQIKEILRKDKVMEIFKDVMVNKAESLFSNQNIATFVAHKFKRKINQIRYAQINLFINLRLISGPRYIEALLARIRLSKEMFLLDLQQGMEVLIPRELSQDHLPMSYRFYDFILQFIQDSVTQDRRDFQKVKMKLARLFDDKLSLKETLGIGSILNKLKKKKETIRQENEELQADAMDIGIKDSKGRKGHTAQVQRSQYILLDDDRSQSSESDDPDAVERSKRTMQEILGLRLYANAENVEDVTDLQKEIQARLQRQKRKNVAIRYLKAEDVLARRQQLTSLKLLFQTRQNTLKQKGQYLESTNRLNGWIFQNIDDLYAQEKERRLALNPERYANLSAEQDEKEMLKFRRFLTESAERMVLHHRTSVQTRKADLLKGQLNAMARYELINKHLDEMIEEDILYFNAKAGDGRAYMFAAVRAAHRRKEKKLKKQREQRGCSHLHQPGKGRTSGRHDESGVSHMGSHRSHVDSHAQRPCHHSRNNMLSHGGSSKLVGSSKSGTQSFRTLRNLRSTRNTRPERPLTQDNFQQ